MKVVLLGATGFVGSALLKEALERGHRVTAIARDSKKLELDSASHSTISVQDFAVAMIDELEHSRHLLLLSAARQ